MGRRAYTEIEHPEAYHAAVKASIHGRANNKRWAAFKAAHPHLAQWIEYQAPDVWIEERQGFDQGKKHPLGYVPTFIRKACDDWGAPSEKAVAVLQRIFDERTANLAKREEERAAERASAQAWQPGRQVVEGEVISVKFVPGWGYHAADVKKILVKRADGSRIYLTCPASIEQAERGARVKLTVTVEPKAEEPTFAFGSRPAKAEIIEEAK